MIYDHPVTAADYSDHRQTALRGLDLWENHGWMVWDRIDGEDLLLWLSPYRIVGHRHETPFAVEDIALSQTMVLRVNHQGAERLKMHDDAFLNVGYDFGDYQPGDALQVQQSETRAVWRIGERAFTAEPPLWRVRGAHAGVDVDLLFEPTGPALWLTDPAKTVEQIHERWHLVCARARGTVTHQGKTFRIDGRASQERHVHCGLKYDPIRLLSSRGITFHAVGFEDKQLLICSRPSLGLAWARLLLPDRVVDFSAPSHACQVIETEQWVDPQSRLQTPCAWRSVFEGHSGRLELTGRAFSRTYYLWPQFKFGCTVLYWWIGDASLRYSLASGENGSVDNLQYVVHDNRLLYRQHRDD
jgi:hypothetical protein